MDVFTWSLPFIGEKITEMMLSMLSICSEDELNRELDVSEQPVTPTEESDARRRQIHNKILAVGRLGRLFGVLRSQSESVSELKTAMGTTSLPVGSLQLGAEGLKMAIKTFEDAKISDAMNERLPPAKSDST